MNSGTAHLGVPGDTVTRLSLELHQSRTDNNTVQPPPAAGAAGRGDYIVFANREPEIEQFVRYPKGQYYLFDAPAGYGKTRLLEHISEVMTKEQGFRCVLVDLSQHSTVRSLASAIASGITGSENYAQRASVGNLALRLGADMATSLKNSTEIKGVCLLFDVDHVAVPDTIVLLREVVEDFLPSVFDSFLYNSQKDGGRRLDFRVAIAGRHLSDTVLNIFKGRKTRYVRRFLKPFYFGTVQDIVERFVGADLTSPDYENTKATICADFAADLLYFTGGHPGGIAKVLLEQYCGSRIPPQHFFKDKDHLDRIRETIKAGGIEVRGSIANKELLSIVEAMCFYRHLNSSMLDHLIQKGEIVWSLDGLELMKHLQRSSVVDWKKAQFRRVIDDDILFNMMVRLLAIEGKVELEEAFQKARVTCERELERATDASPLWALDALGYFLLSGTSRIHDLEGRLSLRTEFFEVDLQSVLKKLVNGRSLRQEYESLLSVLDDDDDDGYCYGEEFSFLVNYFLRDEHYNNEPYKTMRQHVDRFFRSRL